MNNDIKKQVEKIIKEQFPLLIRKYMRSSSFTDMKITDTPIDNFSMTSRKYVNLNGTTANRPTSSITGQKYFDTTVGRPVYWNGSTWVDGAGSVS